MIKVYTLSELRYNGVGRRERRRMYVVPIDGVRYYIDRDPRELKKIIVCRGKRAVWIYPDRGDDARKICIMLRAEGLSAHVKLGSIFISGFGRSHPSNKMMNIVKALLKNGYLPIISDIHPYSYVNGRYITLEEVLRNAQK